MASCPQQQPPDSGWCFPCVCRARRMLPYPHSQGSTASSKGTKRHCQHQALHPIPCAPLHLCPTYISAMLCFHILDITEHYNCRKLLLRETLPLQKAAGLLCTKLLTYQLSYANIFQWTLYLNWNYEDHTVLGCRTCQMDGNVLRIEVLVLLYLQLIDY